MIELLKKYNVRFISTGHDEWFCSKDIQDFLGKENIRVQLAKVKEKYKKKFNVSNVCETYIKNFDESLPNRGITFIKPQAVYQICFRSNKPEAAEFTEWVSEVMELIRSNGYYIATEKDEKWLGTRSNTIETRKTETDTIKEFVDLAKSQGSSKPGWYYKHFTNLVRKKLEIPKELKRDEMQQKVLLQIQSLETLISMKLNTLMFEDVNYKEIYAKISELINDI